jgi:hypothetical protein
VGDCTMFSVAFVAMAALGVACLLVDVVARRIGRSFTRGKLEAMREVLNDPEQEGDDSEDEK